jgi:PadR family transcriptional regulator PadR
MGESKSDVLQGTLDLMVLKTLESMGPLHGYGIARRIEQVSDNALILNQGTIYPALLRLEQRGWISSEWGTSESQSPRQVLLPQPPRPQTNREETENWERVAATMARFLAIRDPLQQGSQIMDQIRTLLSRLATLFRSRKLDAALDEELCSTSTWPPKTTSPAACPRKQARRRPAQLRRPHPDQGNPTASSEDSPS